MFCESKEIKFLSSAYLGRKHQYDFECSKGHKWSTNLASIKNGAGCPVCNGGITGQARLNYIEEKIVQLGYKLLSHYKNQSETYKFECKKCLQIRCCQYRQLRKNSKCPNCSN